MDGRIFQINCSHGGVPKLAVRESSLTQTGLDCDRQAHPNIHGGPERAVRLYSLEKILELQMEGHPIFPGSVGENLTLAGLVWESLKPGSRLRIGEEVLLEIASYTQPCKNIAQSFSDGDFKRIRQQHHPGDSRLYARVLQTGRLTIGQRVSLLSA